MKATTKIQMAVLAVALCAFVAVPASAFAWMPDMPDMPEIPSITIPEPEVHVLNPGMIKRIDPSLIHEFVGAGSEETTIGEPPVAPEEEAEEPVWSPGDAGDDIPETVVDPTHRVSITATPSVTTTPTPVIPRRPYLPFTGGDATPFLVIGSLVALGGCALVLVPVLARKVSAR